MRSVNTDDDDPQVPPEHSLSRSDQLRIHAAIALVLAIMTVGSALLLDIPLRVALPVAVVAIFVNGLVTLVED